MARKPTQMYQLSGPLFDEKVTQRFKDAVNDGMRDLAEEGESTMAGFIAMRGFEKTGATIRSVTSEEHRDSTKAIGWFKVYPTDMWERGGGPRQDRPTRTWLEEGKRNGVKFRRGAFAFRKTTRRLKSLNYNDDFLAKISEALN